MLRTNQTTRRRGLRASTTVAALLGAVALSTMAGGVGYAATQPATRSAIVHANDPGDPTPTDTGLPTGDPTQPDPGDGGGDGGGGGGVPGPGGPTETGKPEPTPTVSSGGAGGGGPVETGGGAHTGTRTGTKTGTNTRTGVHVVNTTDDGLPVTGTNVAGIVTFGGLLTAGGAALVLTGRRRRRTS